MRSALLQYSYGEVFGPLQQACRKKGYSIVRFDARAGVLKASKSKFFGKPIEIEMRVERLDEQITKINVTASSFKISPGSSVLENEEEKLVETIYKYF